MIVKNVGIIDGYDEVEVTVTTESEIPEAHDNWAAGSWLHVLENGGSLYTLGEDRTWYQQGITVETTSEAETAAYTLEETAAYTPDGTEDESV